MTAKIYVKLEDFGFGVGAMIKLDIGQRNAREWKTLDEKVPDQTGISAYIRNRRLHNAYIHHLRVW